MKALNNKVLATPKCGTTTAETTIGGIYLPMGNNNFQQGQWVERWFIASNSEGFVKEGDEIAVDYMAVVNFEQEGDTIYTFPLSDIYMIKRDGEYMAAPEKIVGVRYDMPYEGELQAVGALPEIPTMLTVVYGSENFAPGTIILIDKFTCVPVESDTRQHLNGRMWVVNESNVCGELLPLSANE